MEEYLISFEELKSLADALIKESYDIFAPSADNRRFVKIDKAEQLSLSPEKRPTDISAKSVVFPKSDPLLYYKKVKSNIELKDIEPRAKNVIFGVKPCDASGFRIMHKVFNWDYKDDFFNKRFENTIIIGLACTYSDNFCFCTSVGLSPTDSKGSDIFLINVDGFGFAALVVTEKGSQLIKNYSQYFKKGDSQKSKAVIDSIKGPEKKFDSKKVKDYLDKNFETDLFNPVGDVCFGCGKCAYVCPTCHCFDIVDEDYSYTEGRRMRNWDSCQFSIFTMHASGHNPRDTQAKRYRQRINHKFKYYIDRFQEILCTGCGRCSRGCPVAIDIGAIVNRIGNLSQR
ncbi:MAG: 4Fe-4S dicluster domain-containing protein [Myxococcota bacterium]